MTKLMRIFKIIGFEIIIGLSIIMVIITNFTLGIPNDYLGCMLLLTISLAIRSWDLYFTRDQLRCYELIEKYRSWCDQDDER